MMADGFYERRTLSYDTINRAYPGNGADGTGLAEKAWLDDEPALRLDSEPLPFYLTEFGGDAKNQIVKLTAKVFNRVFGRQLDDDADDRRSKDAQIVVSYEGKLFGFCVIRKRSYLVRAIKGSSSEQNYPDGTKNQGFISTLRISPRIQEDLQKHNVVTDGIVRLTIRQKNFTFIAGLFGKHPRYDVNLGWLFVHVSVFVSLFFFVVGLFSEAYGLPLWTRSKWEWFVGIVTSLFG